MNNLVTIKRFTIRIWMISVLTLITSCTISIYNINNLEINNTKSNYTRINFKKIDNQVRVYLKNQSNRLIFDSRIIHNNPDIDINVDISGLAGSGTHVIFIELFNDSLVTKNPWEIEYQIFQDDKIITHVHEKSKIRAANTGIVFTSEHVVLIP